MVGHGLEISGIFLLADRQEVIATLKSFDWDFSPADVVLKRDDDEMPFRQIGSGNHEGQAAIVLRPRVSWDVAAHFLRRWQEQRSKPLWIAREQ